MFTFRRKKQILTFLFLSSLFLPFQNCSKGGFDSLASQKVPRGPVVNDPTNSPPNDSPPTDVFPSTIGGVGVSVTGGTRVISNFPFLTWKKGMTVAVATSTTGKTWYVNGKATTSGNGTSMATAFKTLQEGVAAAAAGDTILVSAGLYRVPNKSYGLNITKSGSVGKPITLGAYGNGEVIIDSSQATGTWTSLRSNASGTVWQAKAPPGEKVDAIAVNDKVLGMYQRNTSGATVNPGSGEFYTDGSVIVADMGTVNPNSADIVAVQGQHGSVGTISLNGSSYWNFIGLTIRGSGWNGIWSDYYSGIGKNVIFAFNDIKYNDGAGLVFESGGSNNQALYNHIYHNVLNNWPFGANENALNGGNWPGSLTWWAETNSVARGNVVEYNGGEGIINYQTSNGLGGNALVEQNISFENWSVLIYIDSQPGATIRNNLMFRKQTDFSMSWYGQTGSDVGGNGEYYLPRSRACLGYADETGGGELTNTKIYNNMMIGCRFGISDYWEIKSGHGMKNALIANNTIVVDSSVYYNMNIAGIALSYTGDDNANNVNTVIANNIIYRPTTTCSGGCPLISEGGTKIAGITLQNNLYYAVGVPESDLSLFSVNSAVYAQGVDFTNWQKGQGQDSSSVYADPLFNSAASLSVTSVYGFDYNAAAVKSSSPAKNFGIVQSVFTIDFTGVARGANWTAGAIQ
jgi:hypothetical protein